MALGTAVFVLGPAGSGKSTFCASLMQHCETIGRSAHLINLDPAAEAFEYAPSKDIRDLVSVDEVMEEFGYGPNGGLVYCLEYLVENVDWLECDLGEYCDEFLIVDCPGQIELYTHFPIMSELIKVFERCDYRTCAVYLLESLFLQDIAKYFAGVLNATAAMLQLGIPHLNVISKMDLLQRLSNSNDAVDDDDDDDEDVDDETHELHRFFYPDPALLAEHLNASTKPKFYRLNQALVQLLDEYDMVNFIPLNINKESSLQKVLSHIDHATQFTEGLEPREPRDDVQYDDEEHYSHNNEDSVLNNVD